MPRGSVPQRGIEEMPRVAGRSLAPRPARGDEWWRNAAGPTMPKISPMPRWGMARSAAQPGAAPAVAGLPPANFLRRPSGTRSHAVATILSWSNGGHGSGKILARREEFSRSAAVCAEHQPQQLGRRGGLGFQRVPPTIRGRCGWSSADTAALRLGCGSAALCPSGSALVRRRLSTSPSRRSRVFSGLCAASRFDRR